MTLLNHAQSRSRKRSALLVALLAAGGAAATSACSYDAQKPSITLHIDGLSADAVRAEVTLTDTNGDKEQKYFPRFDSGAGAPVDLAFDAPSKGTYTLTVRVQAFDAIDNIRGDGSVSTPGPVTLPDNPVNLQLTLAGVSAEGTYAARCSVTDGGTQACQSGLICVQYQGAGSRGVCTLTCTGTCPTTTTPAATCLDSSSGKACQWECDQTDGGTTACPPGLTCAAQTGTSKKFCQPLP
jgi:hypothetical protein